MEPIILQTLQIMLGLIASDKEGITSSMRKDAAKVINNLMNPILKDSERIFKESSDLIV